MLLIKYNPMITVHQDPTHSFWSRIYISGIFLQKHPSSCNQITPTACRNPFTSPFPFFHQWPRIQCTTTSRSLISASKTFSAWMAAICTTRPIYRYKTVLPGENPPKADGLWSCRGCYPCSPAYFFIATRRSYKTYTYSAWCVILVLKTETESLQRL